MLKARRHHEHPALSLWEGVLGLVNMPVKPELLHERRPGVTKSLGRDLLKERAHFDLLCLFAVVIATTSLRQS